MLTNILQTVVCTPVLNLLTRYVPLQAMISQTMLWRHRNLASYSADRHPGGFYRNKSKRAREFREPLIFLGAL